MEDLHAESSSFPPRGGCGDPRFRYAREERRAWLCGFATFVLLSITLTAAEVGSESTTIVARAARARTDAAGPKFVVAYRRAAVASMIPPYAIDKE